MRKYRVEFIYLSISPTHSVSVSVSVVRQFNTSLYTALNPYQLHFFRLEQPLLLEFFPRNRGTILTYTSSSCVPLQICSKGPALCSSFFSPHFLLLLFLHSHPSTSHLTLHILTLNLLSKICRGTYINHIICVYLFICMYVYLLAMFSLAGSSFSVMSIWCF